MKLSLNDIRSSLPKDKNNYDRLANTSAFLLARPLSYYVTWLCVRLGLSANIVSLASYAFAAIACVLAALNVVYSGAYVVVFVFAWLVLDCVDGNIARSTHSGSMYGEFLDAVGLYIIVGFLPICIGIGIGSSLAVAMGGFASILGILARLIINKGNNIACKTREKSGEVSSSIIITAILSLYNPSGLGLAVLLLAYAFGWTTWYLCLQLSLGVLMLGGAGLKVRRMLCDVDVDAEVV